MRELLISVLLLVLAFIQGDTYPLREYGSPVCAGFRGYQKTFPNMWALLTDIESNRRNWGFIKLGECEQLPAEICPHEYRPVCGYSHDSVKTFTNSCFMNMEMQRTGVLWRAAFPAECETLAANTPEVNNHGVTPAHVPYPAETVSKLRFQTNLNNTFHNGYAERDYHFRPIYNFYEIVFPWYGYAPYMHPQNAAQDYAVELEGSGYGPNPLSPSDVAANPQNEAVVIGGISFPSPLHALTYLRDLAKDLLLYLKAANGV